MTVLPHRRERLVKVLSRLGSDHAGERAAAGLLADRLVRAAGMSWGELLTPAPAPPPPLAPTADRRLAAALCLASGHPWTPWEEHRFLTGVARQHGVTVRQEGVLLRLCRRAGVAFVPHD